MRELLSDIIVKAALEDPKVVILSGDHGYALFDQIRAKSPKQFINVGVMEQAMVGIAAGLAKNGFKPIVYGLSAFVPIRVLEQIKLDVCYSNLPVIFLGDGAGLVYSTLGSSHQCGEDLAALRPIPNIRIYSPSDEFELSEVFSECIKSKAPCYIRIGKSDRPTVGSSNQKGTDPYFVKKSDKNTCIVATGSMTSIANEIASRMNISCLSLPRIKPFPENFSSIISNFDTLYVFEEHSKFGGVRSAILDFLADNDTKYRKIISISLQDKFAATCGSYQHALSEHGISDQQLNELFK